ncbi:MAG: GNAT family N-acetyltransferase [bacterium]|nr:GNAT family N-acetyltransferase [bacterium]
MLNIAPTSSEDLPSIVAMEAHEDNKQYIFPYAIERHQKVIDNHDEYHLKLEDQQDGLVGFAIMVESDMETDSLEFRRLVIQKKGHGYGRTAIKWVKRYCFEEKRYKKLWLDVLDTNTKAQQLYLSEGFKESFRTREFINGEWKNLIVMTIVKDQK